MNASQIASSTTAELVAFYNAQVGADKRVKKFADRKTAERRVAALLDQRPVAPVGVALTMDAHSYSCPSCGIALDNGVGEHNQEVNGKLIKHDQFEFCCLGCGAEFGAPIHKVASSASRSAAIAATWTDPAVKASRSTRTHVTCNGVNYNSVLAAFKALGLPLSKHITFRMALKASDSGTALFGDKYQFRIVTGEIVVK